MSDRPKRRWFQFHLSTALILMFSTGIIIWLNVSRVMLQPRGWPCEMESFEWKRTYTVPAHRVTTLYVNWNVIGLLNNIVIGCTILLLIAFVSEYLIRRREGRKP